MSCVHYQQTNPSKERNYFDGQYSRYVPPVYTPVGRAPESYRSGYFAGWRTSDFPGNGIETPTTARGDPTYGETRMQTGRMTPLYKQETMKHGEATGAEKMQTKMKFLEDSNIVMQTRNQNLITENKALASQLKEERNEVKRLEKRLTLLREELDFERSRIEEMRMEVEKEENKQMPTVETDATSTTNVVARVDRGIQIWKLCMACQRKLESCEKQPPTVTITRSELEVLEKDMKTLRDTIIAREEAWDKAMEREHNYRQQLTRLTTETITARHLSETRGEELKSMTNALSEKESELKTLKKDNVYLNKLIAKLQTNHQREQEGCQRSNLVADVNEKDQRIIEEATRRASSGKSKQKPKSKSSCLERTVHYGTQHISGDKSAKSAKDQTGGSKEQKR